MKPESGKSASIWTSTADVPQFSSLKQYLTCDVCIVGAGITGLSAAYFLSLAGKQVIVLDDGPIAGGETQRTTAHITSIIDSRYFQIEKMHGKEKARMVYESQTAAINSIANIVGSEKIACDFQRLPGYLFLGSNDNEEILEKEINALRRVGLHDVNKLSGLPIETMSSVPCIELPRQAQFHVLKYLSGLASAIVREGGRIFTQTHVSSLEDGQMVEVKTANGPCLQASYVLIATNSPVSDFVKVHTKQAAYRSYVIAGKVPSGTVPGALYWDTEDPYHYLRLQAIDSASGFEMLIVGGEDHKTGQKDDAQSRYNRLERWARSRFPQLGAIELRWSGQLYEPVDALGFIGRDPAHGDNVFISTGASGVGMTHGALSGLIISDLILGKKNDWIDLYSPSRKPLASLSEYARENLNVAGQYFDHLTGGDVDDVSQIVPGEGAVIKRGHEKIAVYKDTDGSLCRFSAVCPHLKAILQWNSAEKSWDCPAHGSRFTAGGCVIDGPANTDLKPVEETVDGGQTMILPQAESVDHIPGQQF